MSKAIFVGKNETQVREVSDPAKMFYRFTEWELLPLGDPEEQVRTAIREITFKLSSVDYAQSALIYRQIA